MGAEEHDAVFGAVSHLPHAIAFALVAELAARPNARQLFGHAASGFRDFTRIAGSSPEMWRDIVLDNRAVLVGELDRIMTRLQCLRAAIATGDGQAIEQQFGVARAAREKWLAGELDHFRDEAV
jgi:prephenate dehydrogenase